SSRRRHTIFSRDWSSDVCSSDLCLWSCTMEKLRHSPGNLTCHSERTGFYSEGVWCAATLHRPAVDSQHARPAILMVHGWGGIQRSEERRVGKEGRCGRRTCNRKE